MKLYCTILMIMTLLTACNNESSTNLDEAKPERDEEFGILDPLTVQNELRVLIQKIESGQEYRVKFVSEHDNSVVITRTVEFNGENVMYYFKGLQEDHLICESLVEEDRGSIRVFQLRGCDNTAGVLEINFSK